MYADAAFCKTRQQAEAMARKAEALQKSFPLLSTVPSDVLDILALHSFGIRLLTGESPLNRQCMYFCQAGVMEVEGEVRRKSVGGALVSCDTTTHY